MEKKNQETKPLKNLDGKELKKVSGGAPTIHEIVLKSGGHRKFR